MLTTHLFSKNIKTQITLPRQWLHVTLNVLRSNSSLSDSSDSDSDAESSNKNAIGKNKNIAEDSDDITSLTHNVKSRKMKIQEYFQVAKEKKKEKQIRKQLTKAATVLTTTEEPNKDNIVSSLLDNIFTIRSGNRSKELHKFDKNYFESKKLLKKRSANKRFEAKHEVKATSSIIEKLKKQQEDKIKTDRSEMKSKVQAESPIIKMLLEQQQNKKKTPYVNEDNVQSKPEILKILEQWKEKTRNQGNFTSTFKMQESPKYSQKAAESTNNFETSKTMEDHSIIKILQSQQVQISNTYKFEKNDQYRGKVLRSKKLKNEKEKEKYIDQQKTIKARSRLQEYTEYEQIFTNDFTNSSPTPELKIWDLCQEKEFEIITKPYPKNGFEEMIQWTEEGKLWKFPIDNEQGMEEEQNVHFSKHVFLERHLEEWCPTKGPIRHFMELVCNGLSKNPYMTIEEKYNHIMWYKDYFNGKQDLLHKLGLIE